MKGRQSVDLNKLISRCAEAYWCAPVDSTAGKSYTSPEVSLVPETQVLTADALKSTPPKSHASAKVSTPDTSLASSSSLSSNNMNEELEGAASVQSIQSPPQIRRVSLDRNDKTTNCRTDEHEVNSEKFRCVPKRLPMMVFETYCQSRSDKVPSDGEDEVPSDEENGQLSVSNAATPKKDHNIILEEYGLTRSSRKVSLISTVKPTEIQLHTVVRHSEEGDDVSSSASVSMFDEDDLKTITARQIGTYLSVSERNRIGKKVLQATMKSGYQVVEAREGPGSLCETCNMPRFVPGCKTETTSSECPFCPALKMKVLKKIFAGESPVYDYVATPQLTLGVQGTSRQFELNRVTVGSGGPPMQQLRDAEEFVLAAHQSIASIGVDEPSKLCGVDEALKFDQSLAKARKRLTSKFSDSLQAGNEGRDGKCPVPEVNEAVRCKGIDLSEGKEALAHAKQALAQEIDLVSQTISPSRSAIAATLAKQGSSEYVSLNQGSKHVALEEDFSCSVEVSMTSEEVNHSDEGCFVMLDATAQTNAQENLHAQNRGGIPRDEQGSEGMPPADTKAASQIELGLSKWTTRNEHTGREVTSEIARE